MQSKLASFCEVCINTAIGFIIAFATQLVLNQVYDIQMTTNTALAITLWFTMVSILRSYIIRRIANYITNRKTKLELETKRKLDLKNACHLCGHKSFIKLSSTNEKLCSKCGSISKWVLQKGETSTLIKGLKHANQH